MQMTPSSNLIQVKEFYLTGYDFGTYPFVNISKTFNHF